MPKVLSHYSLGSNEFMLTDGVYHVQTDIPGLFADVVLLIICAEWASFSLLRRHFSLLRIGRNLI